MDPVHLGPLVFDVSTWVYTTVTLMATLVVYDGWQELKGPGGVAMVVVGPTIALGAAHTFAEVLEQGVTHEGWTPRRDAAAWIGDFLQFLLVAVPPLLTLVVTSLVLNQTPTESVRSMLILGTASLGFWGGLAAWRARMRGIALVLAVLAGWGLGLLVFAFQIALKPH